MTILTFAAEKGGVGKTTTAANVAACLSRSASVLLVDADPQGSLTESHLGYRAPAGVPTLGDVLIDPAVNIVDAIVQAPLPAAPRLDLLPSGRGTLEEAGYRMLEQPGTVMRDALAPLRSFYQWIVIDTPPNLSTIPYSAFIAADGVVGVLTLTQSGLRGLRNTFASVRKHAGPGAVLGAVVNQHQGQYVLSRDIEEMLPTLDAPVFATRIPRRVKINEEETFGVPSVAIDAWAGEDFVTYYFELAAEIAQAASAAASGAA